MWAAIAPLPNAAAGESPCASCASMHEPEIFYRALSFARMGCGVSKQGEVVSNVNAAVYCHGLFSTIASMGCSLEEMGSDFAEIKEWLAFKKRFTSPCQPIPQKYLDSRSPFFHETIKLLAPVVVS